MAGSKVFRALVDCESQITPGETVQWQAGDENIVHVSCVSWHADPLRAASFEEVGTPVSATVDPVTGVIGNFEAGGSLIGINRNSPLLVNGRGNVSAGSTYSTLENATFSGSGGSGAFDAAASSWGNVPAVLTVNAGSAANYAQLVDTGIPGAFLDDGGQFFMVAEIVSGMNDNNVISVIFSSDGATTKTATVSFKINKRRGNLLYFRFSAGANEFTFAGGESFANTMNYMAVKVDSAGGTTGGVIKIHGIWRRQRQRTSVVIGFDDGWLTQYSSAFQYMAQRGLVGYTAASVDYVGGNYMSTAQMDEMYQAGWDIAVHGAKNHNDASLGTSALLKAEIQRNLDYIRGQGWPRGAKCYIYPGGIVNPTTGSKQALQELEFTHARTVTWGAGGTNDQCFTSPYGLDDPYCIAGRDLSGAFSAASNLSLLDRAIDNGSSVWYYGHSIVRAAPAADQMTYAEFKTFIDGVADRAAGGKCDVLTPSQFGPRYL